MSSVLCACRQSCTRFIFFSRLGPASLPKILAEPQIRDVVNVCSSISAKWQAMGIQLGLQQNELDGIEMFAHDPQTCLQKMFARWKDRQCSDYSWTTIYAALMSPSVCELDIASVVKTNYLS